MVIPSEEFRSINEREHLPVFCSGRCHLQVYYFVGFVLFIVNCRTPATRNFAAEKAEAVEANTSYGRV